MAGDVHAFEAEILRVTGDTDDQSRIFDHVELNPPARPLKRPKSQSAGPAASTGDGWNLELLREAGALRQAKGGDTSRRARTPPCIVVTGSQAAAVRLGRPAAIPAAFCS